MGPTLALLVRSRLECTLEKNLGAVTSSSYALISQCTSYGRTTSFYDVLLIGAPAPSFGVLIASHKVQSWLTEQIEGAIVCNGKHVNYKV
jgi:hypothetical protein